MQHIRKMKMLEGEVAKVSKDCNWVFQEWVGCRHVEWLGKWFWERNVWTKIWMLRKSWFCESWGKDSLGRREHMQRFWCISKLGPSNLEPARRWVWLRWHELEAEDLQRSSEGFRDPGYCRTLEVPVRHLVLLWVAKGRFQHFDRKETLSNCVKKQQGQKSWCQSRSFVRVRVRLIGFETRG